MQLLVSMLQKCLQAAICVYNVVQLLVPDPEPVKMLMYPVLEGQERLSGFYDSKALWKIIRKRADGAGTD